MLTTRPLRHQGTRLKKRSSLPKRHGHGHGHLANRSLPAPHGRLNNLALLKNLGRLHLQALHGLQGLRALHGLPERPLRKQSRRPTTPKTPKNPHRPKWTTTPKRGQKKTRLNKTNRTRLGNRHRLNPQTRGTKALPKNRTPHPNGWTALTARLGAHPRHPTRTLLNHGRTRKLHPPTTRHARSTNNARTPRPGHPYGLNPHLRGHLLSGHPGRLTAQHPPHRSNASLRKKGSSLASFAKCT